MLDMVQKGTDYLCSVMITVLMLQSIEVAILRSVGLYVVATACTRSTVLLVDHHNQDQEIEGSDATVFGT